MGACHGRWRLLIKISVGKLEVTAMSERDCQPECDNDCHLYEVVTQPAGPRRARPLRQLDHDDRVIRLAMLYRYTV